MPPPGRVRLRLEPLGQTLDVEAGSRLQEALFPWGVEFPCGGHGRCRKCRVRVLEGHLPASLEEIRILGPAEIAAGWRLACRAEAREPLTLEVAQWEPAILSDETAFEFRPRDGLGAAVDIGTTTVVAQLLDLEIGCVAGVRAALNPQAVHGADVMSRVDAALGGARERLTGLIREAVGAMLRELIENAPAGKPLREVVLVGNTVMHNLFCGIHPEPLSRFPFEPSEAGLAGFKAAELGWQLPGDPLVQFLPCLGGFVGSDILAGILACGLENPEQAGGLLDLGTNGEIVISNAQGIRCASAAAGPAFEGGRISMGMRAATGAIAEVEVEAGAWHCRVLGGGAARGICGSGLVDAAAVGLELGLIEPGGRLAGGRKEWTLTAGVKLAQKDIRELQLAKAAVAAGVRILVRRAGSPRGVMHLAGAFGNYVNRTSAKRIGLLEFAPEYISPAGNTALLGAKMALFGTEPDDRSFDALRRRIEHVPLAADPEFEETYIQAMHFPEA